MSALLLALAVGASAGSLPELPRRLEPRPARVDADRTLKAEKTERLAVLVAGKDPARAVEAARALAEKTDQTARPEGARYDWAPADAALGALEKRGRRPPALRRALVLALFPPVCARVLDRALREPDDAAADRRWARCTALRDAGLRDKDARLAEYFERHQEGGGERWRAARSAGVHRLLAARKAFPEREPRLLELTEFLNSVESAQSAVLERLLRKHEARPAADPRREGLIKAERSVYEHRLLQLWTNQFPRHLAEVVGAKEAERLGAARQPLREGWPELPPR